MGRRLSRSYIRRRRRRVLVSVALILLTILVSLWLTRYYEEHKDAPGQLEIPDAP